MNAKRTCPTCGAELPGDAPMGQCVPCLLRNALPEGGTTEAGDSPQETILITPTVPSGEKPGDRIGRYKLLQAIGEGGMGSVWMAEQEEPVRRRVALKVIKLGMDTKQVIGRFEAERQALAMMDHPNIAKVFDAGATDNGRPFFVMELVRGIPITRYCDENKLGTRERLELFIQVCEAIQHAHQKGIIHRDIKPSNIMVTNRDGTPVIKVIDFGIAKATDQKLTDKTVFTAFEQFIGTPAYMSPEQAEMNAQDIDTRTDIYALGVLLYELLTGKTPFDAKELISAGVEGMRKMIREREPARPSTRISSLENAEQTTVANARHSEPPKLIHLVRGDLDWVAMKCLEKDRTRRYETANGLARDIQRHLNNEPVVARPPSNLYRFQKLVRRNKLSFVAASIIALMLLVVAVGGTWLAIRATRAERYANEESERAKKEAARAESSAQAETQQRKIAEGEKARANQALASSLVVEGDRLAKEDQAGKGLAYFARALRLNPANRVAPYRIVSLLNQRDFPIQLPGRPESLAFDPFVVLAYSGDWRRYCVRTNDNSLVVLQNPSGTPIGKPIAFIDRPIKIALNEDGSRLALGSEDKAVVWECEPPRRLAEIKGRLEALSPDGKLVLISDRIVAVDSGKELCAIDDKGRSTAVFSPDGQKVAFVTKSRGGKTVLLSATNGQPVIPEISNPMHAYPMVAFSGDSRQAIILGSAYGEAWVWELAGGKPRNSLKNRQRSSGFTSLGPSFDGRLIAVGSRTGEGFLWNLTSSLPTREPIWGPSAVSSMACSPGGGLLAARYRDRTLFWDSSSGRARPVSLDGGATIFPKTTQVCFSGFSKDGALLATACSNVACLWRPDGEASVFRRPGAESLTSVALAPNSGLLAAAEKSGRITLWHVGSGRVMNTFTINSGNVRLLFSADSRLLTAGSGDADWQRGSAYSEVAVWETQSGKSLLNVTNDRAALMSFTLSPDAKSLAVGYVGTAELWDIATAQNTGKPMHTGTAFQLTFSHDGKWLGIASSLETAQVFDGFTGQGPMKTYTHGSGVFGIQFSSDDKLVVTASYDGTARVWQRETGEPVTEPLTHNEWVENAFFSPDDHKVITSGRDGVAIVWDVSTGRPLSEPIPDGNFACFTPDGGHILTEGGGIVKIHDWVDVEDIAPPWLAELAEAVGCRELNESGVTAYLADAAERIVRLRKQFNDRAKSPLEKWAKWFLADRSTRTISPNSTMSIAKCAERLMKQDSFRALEEAVDLNPQDPSIYERLASFVEQGQPESAVVYRRIAAQLRGDKVTSRAIGESTLGEVAKTAVPQLDPLDVGAMLKREGQNVRLQGRIVDFSAGPSGRVYFLGFSTNWKSRFDLVFFRSPTNQEFTAEILQHYTNKTVAVEGVVKIYKGKPEIVLDSLAQIKIVDNAPPSSMASDSESHLERYTYSGGYFAKMANGSRGQWKEVKTAVIADFYFEELKRDGEVIVLKDASRNFRIQIPIKGGMSKLSTDDGKTWRDLYEVKKE
ncbi:MAG: WD40 repeat domain-containing serine/threonine-protein kinase [Verrucomicrobiota bacterium]